MFHTIKLERIQILSNPSLPDLPVLDYEVSPDGTPRNRYLMKPQDHRGYLYGAHFNPDTMSLRSRLNRGVDLQVVNYGQLENDPNRIQAISEHFSESLISSINSRNSKSSSDPVAAPAESKS